MKNRIVKVLGFSAMVVSSNKILCKSSKIKNDLCEIHKIIQEEKSFWGYGDNRRLYLHEWFHTYQIKKNGWFKMFFISLMNMFKEHDERTQEKEADEWSNNHYYLSPKLVKQSQLKLLSSLK